MLQSIYTHGNMKGLGGGCCILHLCHLHGCESVLLSLQCCTKLRGCMDDAVEQSIIERSYIKYGDGVSLEHRDSTGSNQCHLHSKVIPRYF